MLSFSDYIGEAVLSSKSSKGDRKWDHIKNNIDSIDFRIERGKEDTWIMNEAGEPLTVLQPGDIIKILSTEEKTFGRYSAVKVKDRRGNKGWLFLSKIRNPGPSTTKVEDLTLSSIRNNLSRYIEEYGSVNLYLDKKHKMKNVVDIIQPKGDPKADFVVIDSNGKGVGFISHKKGGGAKAFQQYGGISGRSGLLKYGNSNMINEVDEFIKAAYEHVMREGGKISYRVYRPVKSSELIRFSVYGNQFNDSEFGIENVNIIGQGNPIIEEYKDGYNLTFDDVVHHNPDVSWAKKGAYQAIFVARHIKERPLRCLTCNISIENMRGGIFNIEYLNSTSEKI